ncbi:hypothetical protein GA0061081_11048 [Gilliamella bombicola]|uniref:Lipoprotein n=1 Tax=Gilliamella bombicola TaxID=1798182 RepID=A0A1C4CR03_9GAMM|nr:MULTISPECIES: hypothetical protein [Gilliamella]NUF26816.1 hypothetical protein [Gilliamella sp. ESL0254]SCC21480.1 hypothetical protein GA0061081_11048 [Gilliamella bombicola]
MLKRIVAFLLMAFALSGCSPEVTEDMLIGKWICHNQGVYNIGKNANDERNYEINDIPVRYEKHEDNSMTKQSYNLVPEKFSFKRYRKEHHNLDKNIEYEYIWEYQYVSDDEFKYVHTYSSRYIQTKKPSELDVWTTTCFRQKN